DRAAGVYTRPPQHSPQLQQVTNPQQPVENPQQQQQQPVDGVDPELAAAINNPKVRLALEQEIQTVEAARGQYQAASLQAAQLAAAALFSFAPELQNISAAEMPVALRLIAAKDPQRAQQIEAHVQRTQALFTASQQAAQHQQQIQAQQMQNWARAEDAKFEESVKGETRETRRLIEGNVMKVMQE